MYKMRKHFDILECFGSEYYDYLYEKFLMVEDHFTDGQGIIINTDNSYEEEEFWLKEFCENLKKIGAEENEIVWIEF